MLNIVLVVTTLCCIICYSGERSVLNRRQARYILHNVNEVSRILQSRLGRDQVCDSVTVTRGVAMADDSAGNRFSALYRRFVNTFCTYGFQCVPLALAICVVIALYY